jgi:hypothetical protein
MITTLPRTTEEAPPAGAIRSIAAPTTNRAALAVPQARDHPWLPYAIGALLGLVVVLALAAWAFLLLSGGDYSDVIDLSQVITA